MPRGVRKTPKEILQDNLRKTEDAIAITEKNLRELQGKASELRDQINTEELKEIQNLMVGKGMSFHTLRALVEAEADK